MIIPNEVPVDPNDLPDDDKSNNGGTDKAGDRNIVADDDKSVSEDEKN